MAMYAWANGFVIALAVLVLILLVLYLFRRNARAYLRGHNECQGGCQAPRTRIFIVATPEEIPALMYGPEGLYRQGVAESTQNGAGPFGQHRLAPSPNTNYHKGSKKNKNNKHGASQGGHRVSQNFDETVIQLELGLPNGRNRVSQNGAENHNQHDR